MASEETMLRKLQEAGWPSPVRVNCTKLDINSVVEALERSHMIKAFYSEIVRWLIESEGKPTFRKVTGIENESDIRKAMFGDIKDKEIVTRLLEYVCSSAPGQVISLAKSMLEKEIAEYLRYYVTKTKPPELVICDKLKNMGIFTIAYIEDTFEYGPVVRLIINPQGLLNQLVSEPSKSAELATVAKVTEWILSNTDENIVFVVDDEENPKKVMLASTTIENRDAVIDLLNKLLVEISRLETVTKESVISSLMKYFL